MMHALLTKYHHNTEMSVILSPHGEKKTESFKERELGIRE